MIITISNADDRKTFYSAFATFKPDISLKKRLAFANKANGKIVGAIWVKKHKLRCSGWLSPKGGILMSTVVTMLGEFREIFEGIVLEMGSGLLLVDRESASLRAGAQTGPGQAEISKSLH